MNLDAALELLLPAPRDTLLLQAALLDGDAAREAWAAWTRDIDVMATLGRDAIVARSILPLLYDSVRRNALPVTPETATYLRSAYLRETLRTKIYFEIVDELAAALDRAGVAFQLIKGAAIARQFYAEPALRHAHDVEIAVLDEGAARAAATAFPNGVHATGLPLRIWCVASLRPASPTTILASVLTHAAQNMSRSTCRWVADASTIIRKSEIDWNAIPATLATRKQLAYLRDAFRFDVHVPDVHPTRKDLEATVRGLYAGRFSWWRRLWREGDARIRWTLLVTLLRPHPVRRAIAYARRFRRSI